jgi:hypothetical protein
MLLGSLNAFIERLGPKRLARKNFNAANALTGCSRRLSEAIAKVEFGK